MELMPKSIAKNIPALYETEACPLEDKVVYLKLFTPWTNWTWYAVEFDPEQNLFWGLAVGHEAEWGYFSLDELKGISGPFGLRIERDIHFRAKKVKDMIQSERLAGVL